MDQGRPLTERIDYVSLDGFHIQASRYGRKLRVSVMEDGVAVVTIRIVDRTTPGLAYERDWPLSVLEGIAAQHAAARANERAKMNGGPPPYPELDQTDLDPVPREPGSP